MKGWFLPFSRINDLQQRSLDRIVAKAKQSHFTNVVHRLNGKDVTEEADWIKHMDLVNIPSLDTVKDATLSGAEIDDLIALVECGPLEDGDVPSKSGRDSLIEKGLAVRVVVKGQDGYTAATYAGARVYKARYPGPDGAADTLAEAQLNRTTARVLQAAARKT